ncbi:Rab geranylgeranyltransferase, partial [Ascosphaera atra]
VEETQSDESTQSQDEKVAQPSIAQLLEADLMFLYPMLKKSPKCYWIWNHRMWLLEQTTRYLSLETSLGYWRQEFALVGKMLALDNRNFHGWGYRRKVVSAIESLVDMQNTEQGRTKEEMKHSLAKEELDYTTKMIGVNLSNFSAWHNRTTLLVRMLNENEATDAGRRKRLDEELDLIHNALIDPYDQSLWFYHQNLMSTFDPSRAAQTFCPRLTTAERIEYVENEIEEIRDMLDGAETCKWIYIALIEARLLLGRLQEKGLDEDGRGQVLGWVGAVKKLDPLRRNRWIELEEQVDAMR